MKSELSYEWVDDETAEVYVDGSFIGYLTHYDFGWDGMREAQKILNSVATLKGWTISVKGAPAV